MQEIDMRLTNLEQKYMGLEQQMNLASLGITDADRELTYYCELILKLKSPEEKLDEQGRIIGRLTAGNSELHLFYESETNDFYQRLNALEGCEVIYRDHVNEFAKRGSSAMAELEKNEALPETNLKLKQELETHQIKINEIQERYQKRINEILEHLNASDHMKMDGIEQTMKTFAKLRNQQVRNRFLISEVRSLASGDAPRFISNVKDLNKRLTAFEIQPKISEEHANVEVDVTESNKVEVEEESLLKLNRVDGSIVGEQQRKASQFPTENEEKFYEYLQTLGKTLEYLKHQFATEGHKLQSQVEAPSKYSTFDTLEQHWLFIPAKHKECYLVYLLSEMSGSTSMVFTCTCETTRLLALILRNLGFKVISISGQMSQANKLGALNQFKAGGCNILICNDAASRGLDIPSMDIVINYDIPSNSKDYIHLVGRTARAVAISLVNQYELHDFFQIEKLIGKILPVIFLEEEREKVLLLSKRITEAKISYLMKNKVRRGEVETDGHGTMCGRVSGQQF